MATTVRVADYIASILVAQGIRDVFMVTGGGAMHLNDALGRNKGLRYICCHHEQACAIAADSYFRVSGRLAAVNVTTGPGGINALNGVFGAYVDSLGMVVLSGQVKRETLVRTYPLPLRQLGDQEVDIVTMARSVVKYATILDDPSKTRWVIEKAVWLAKNGRPGPVWVDVPIDIQGALVDPERLPAFDPMTAYDPDPDVSPNTFEEANLLKGAHLRAALKQLLSILGLAKRPVLLAGAGVRLSGMHDLFLKLVAQLGIPVVSAWNAHDVITNDDRHYCGRPGTVGDRGGNFTVQNADFVLVLGNRLNIRQISYNWSSFARFAYIAMVDIDRAELRKPTLKTDLPIHADLRDVVPGLLELAQDWTTPSEHIQYLAWCRERCARYPVVQPVYWDSSEVNPYCFMSQLFAHLKEGDLVVSGDGTACVTSFQAAALKAGQRLYTNSGCASMGYDLPGAIGAYYATGAKRVICLAGDGSIMMNLQELQTIVGHGLPIKIFVLNNDGYHSIRQTQEAYFPDNVVGCGPESHLTFPDFQRVLAAFGFGTRLCKDHRHLSEFISATLDADGPQVCEVILEKRQAFAPKLSSRKLEDGRMVSSPLEDMFPFLARDELSENILSPLPPLRDNAEVVRILINGRVQPAGAGLGPGATRAAALEK